MLFHSPPNYFCRGWVARAASKTKKVLKGKGKSYTAMKPKGSRWLHTEAAICDGIAFKTFFVGSIQVYVPSPLCVFFFFVVDCCYLRVAFSERCVHPRHSLQPCRKDAEPRLVPCWLGCACFVTKHIPLQLVATTPRPILLPFSFLLLLQVSAFVSVFVDVAILYTVRVYFVGVLLRSPSPFTIHHSPLGRLQSRMAARTRQLQLKPQRSWYRMPNQTRHNL